MNVNPAEKYAALKLLEAGLKSALVEAKADVEAYATATGAASLKTDWGKVSIAEEKFNPQVADSGRFTEWVKENAPDEIQESVNPAYSKAFLSQCDVDDETGAVSYKPTGEVLPFMGLRVSGGYASARLAKDVKDKAAELVYDRIADLLPKELGRG